MTDPIKHESCCQPSPGSAHHCHGGYQAFRILQFVFIFLPIVAGLDKFFHVLTNWDLYLSPQFNLLGDSHKTMMVVGSIEVIVGILVWIKPKIFAYVVAAWLVAIIVNLLLLGSHFDIAARDFGLALSAIALARLACKHSK